MRENSIDSHTIKAFVSIAFILPLTISDSNINSALGVTSGGEGSASFIQSLKDLPQYSAYISNLIRFSVNSSASRENEFCSENIPRIEFISLSPIFSGQNNSVHNYHAFAKFSTSEMRELWMEVQRSKALENRLTDIPSESRLSPAEPMLRRIVKDSR
jgi:hypothetical protein